MQQPQPKDTESTLEGFCHLLATNVLTLAKVAQEDLPKEGAGPLFVQGYVASCKDVAEFLRNIGTGMSALAVEEVKKGLFGDA